MADFQVGLKRRMLEVLVRDGIRSRSVVTLPTGGGKTRVAVEAFIDWMQPRFAAGQYLLWVAQSEELCEQAIASLRGGSLRAKTAGRRLSWRNRIIARQKLKLSVRLSRLKTYGPAWLEYHALRQTNCGRGPITLGGQFSRVQQARDSTKPPDRRAGFGQSLRGNVSFERLCGGTQ